MSKNLQKNLFIIAALAIMYLANSNGWFQASEEISQLSTASVITPEFEAKVETNKIEICAFQSEIDQSFEGLNIDSSNYKVLYEATRNKFSGEKYEDCDIPKIQVDDYGLRRVDSMVLDELPVVDMKSKSESQTFPKIESTYYERAYGYIPEVPNPVSEYNKPE